MIIYGFHAFKSAESSGKNIIKAYIIDKKNIPDWLKSINKNKILQLEKASFEAMLPKDSVHQGIALEIEDITYSNIEDLHNTNNNCTIAILDNVTDPHNFGAIIRTAAVFGISHIVIPEKSSCKVTPTTIKVASGGLDHVNIIIVKNLSQAIKKLKQYGFWIVALCEKGDQFLDEIDLTGKTALILGAEGAGIRRLQQENADFTAKIRTSNSFSTLNVSTSAAVSFYEAAKQNGFNFL